MVTRVENKEGYTVLSRRRAAEIEARERLAKLAETKEEIQGKVTEVVKGGLLVDLGMRGFVPASQIELSFVDDLNKYIGKKLRLRVIEFDSFKKKLVLSQKVILAEEQLEKREELFRTLQEGDVVKGIVRRLVSFGAFIDLGGADGLLHVSDMAYSRVNNPSEIVKVDDEVEVQILRVDKEKGRISLGLKQLKVNPWSVIAEKYPLGAIVKGKVVRIAVFGAFVQLEDGVDALVHISQLADHRVSKVEDIVEVGQVITAKVIECKPEGKRISLSIKEVLLDSQKASDQEALDSQQESPIITIGDAVGDIQDNSSKE
jgi:4-hydroxy-3-methylbut-2-enyl diphosphate reductase